MSSQPPTTVTSACHCGASTFNLSFPTTTLPKTTDYCHCTSCRRSTGAPFNTFMEAPTAPFPYPAIPSTLHTYNSSQESTRYFCTTCGAHMAIDYHGGKEWYIATGTLSRVDGIYDLRWHQWLKDTGDGGISRVIDDGLPRYAIGKEEDPFEQPEQPLLPPKHRDRSEGNDDFLHLSCRCNAIHLTISRPSTNPSGPGVSTQATPDLHRWTVGFCFCDDCRLTSGFPVAGFMQVGRDHFTIRDQGEKLVRYKSSERATRTFCGCCGATVMFEGNGEGVGHVDIAMGLLEVDVEGGEGFAGKVESWFVYEEKIDFAEQGREKGLVEGLGRGLKARGKEEVRNEGMVTLAKHETQEEQSIT